MKIEINKKLFELAQEKKHPAHILEAIAVQEKSKAADRFYNQFGYEIHELAESCERLKLLEDKEFRALMQTTQEVMEDFVKDQQQQKTESIFAEEVLQNDAALF